ncbi:integrase catalytic domain-containing protein [Trichonephila inaurata madagascariensis]|uniref:Integrase catalytic domain-containing protein n=1 Tax=Trichonephila inaurata madagascariensis TaxID=2747483 RepID=A0A8X6I7V4_9ARAC|nr:integrase catalytic domain-containing protein [Trichonephila inaurata madagascariensis]
MSFPTSVIQHKLFDLIKRPKTECPSPDITFLPSPPSSSPRALGFTNNEGSKYSLPQGFTPEKHQYSLYHNSKREELTVNEIQITEKKLLKLVQQESFDDTVTQNKLKSLNVFTDNEGLMRLETKIVRRKDDENFICPIVLPSNHLLMERLIFENHSNSCHSGTQFVLSNLRQQLWTFSGRKTVQRVINQCIHCKIYFSKEIKTVPAPLPEDRVRNALVFELTCVGKSFKVLQSLSTDGFLLGLRRFTARRGRPRKIYRDNGTNFIGANNLMASLDWKKITLETSILRIQWSFNPLTASWW